AGLELEHLDPQMIGSAVARRGKGEFTRVLLRVLNQLLERVDANRGMNDKAADDVADAPDRIEALDGIVGGLAQGRYYRERRVGGQKERVAVGWGLGRRLGADHAASSASVLDHELLAEGLGELVGPKADRWH